LASYSNAQLEKFCIGIYKDNALCSKMRFDEKDTFRYLVKRGLSIQRGNHEGYNALHYAIKMEQSDFLCFMLEGEF